MLNELFARFDRLAEVRRVHINQFFCANFNYKIITEISSASD